MHLKTKQLQSTKIELSFSADGADLTPIKQLTVTKLGSQLKIPGFRPGKAPQAVIEKHLDQNLLQSEVIEEAINRFYARAVDTEKLRPVAQPAVSIKKFVPYSSLEFVVTVSVVGKISLPDYKKLRLNQPVATVTASDINDVITSLQERLADRTETDKPAKKGDQATIDFKGVDEAGQPISGAEGHDYPLVLGSDAFIPGFETNLLGLKAGQEKTFDLTFPKDYAVSALANKKVTFSVSVKKVAQLNKLPLDDEFAKKAGPFKTVAELKADIKKQLTSERQQNADREFQNEILETLAAKSTVEIPEELIDEQLDASEAEERQNLVYRGQTWQEHLEAEGVTEEQHRQQNRPKAELRVKAGLVLSEIAEKEGLDVTPEELEIRIQLLKAQYQDPTMQAELEKPENRRDIAMRLLSEKTIQLLVQYVTGKKANATKTKQSIKNTKSSK